MICPKCGAENPNNSKFCGLCGDVFRSPEARKEKYGHAHKRDVNIKERNNCIDEHAQDYMSRIGEDDNHRHALEKNRSRLSVLKSMNKRTAVGLFLGICLAAVLVIPGARYGLNRFGDSERVVESEMTEALDAWKAGAYDPENKLFDDDYGISQAVLMDYEIAGITEIGWKNKERDKDITSTLYVATVNLTFQSKARTELHEQKRYYIFRDIDEWVFFEKSLLYKD